MRFLLGSMTHAPTSPASEGVASRMRASVAPSRSAKRTPAIAAALGVRSERLIGSSPSFGLIRIPVSWSHPFPRSRYGARLSVRAAVEPEALPYHCYREASVWWCYRPTRRRGSITRDTAPERGRSSTRRARRRTIVGSTSMMTSTTPIVRR